MAKINRVSEVQYDIIIRAKLQRFNELHEERRRKSFLTISDNEREKREKFKRIFTTFFKNLELSYHYDNGMTMIVNVDSIQIRSSLDLLSPD